MKLTNKTQLSEKNTTGLPFRLMSLILSGVLLISCGAGLTVNAEPSHSSAEQYEVPGNEASDNSDEESENVSGDSSGSKSENEYTEKPKDKYSDDNNEYAVDPEDEQLLTTASEFLDLFNNDYLYTSVRYDNNSGLPTSEANAIAQTSDGFIWVGSYGGLFRYDSNHFEKIELNGINGIKSLYTDSQDRLWIGSADNGIALMENNSIHYRNEEDGFISGSINVITEDESGFIYFGTDNGLAFADSNLSVTMSDDERVSKKIICDLKKGPDGLVYGLEKEGYVFTVKEGKIQQYITSGCENPVCLLPDPLHPGSLYLSSPQTQYYGTINNKGSGIIIEDTFRNGLSNTKNMEYVGGLIWYCASSDIYAFRPENHRKNYVLYGRPIRSSLSHVMQDYQGNFWFTSNFQGIVKTVPSSFLDLNDRFAYASDAVNCTCLYSSTLLMGTDGGIFMLSEDSSDIEFSEMLYKYNYFEQIDSNTKVTYIFSDKSNALYIATWGKGLFRVDKEAMLQFTENSKDAKLTSNYVHYVKEASDGSLLIAVEGGLDIIKDNKLIKSYGRNDSMENTSINTVEEGVNGEILLGSDGGGIYVIEKDGTVKNYGRNDGLTSGTVSRIKKDRTRDIYWILTNTSIAYMTADMKITNVTSFPYQLNYDVFQNSRDEMWVLSSNGIYVLPTEKMLKDDAGSPMHYGAQNALTRVPTANSFSELTESGELYLSGNTGTTKVNIEKAFQCKPEIKTCIPYIEADGERLYPDKNGNISFPPTVKRLVIYAYVPDYSLTTPNVSYILEGFDTEYTTVSRSELMPAEYTNLSGGNYRFVMNVFSNDGTQYSTASVNITKQKAFYEEAWFYIVIGILSLLLISIASQIIWISRMKKLRIKHREEVERERISTELETASDIQNDMLPDVFPAFPDRNDFDIFAKMDPAKEVGGDFYDFFLTDDDHLCMIIADVSGKGIPAALFMMRSKIILQESAKASGSPADILKRANDSVCANNKAEMFVSVWLGILELSTGRLIAANAGHEFPVLTNTEGKFELYKDKHGMVVGGMPGYKYKEYELSLVPGSKLFLYTDGVPEATDASEQLFGFDRMVEALNEDLKATPEQILINVRQHIDAFVKDAEQFDDLTMLCVEYKGLSAEDKTE